MDQTNQRVYKYAFSNIYPLYVEKVERKGRSKNELDEVLSWLTGFSQQEIDDQIKKQSTLEEFFAQAKLNPSRRLITGVICGVRVEEIKEPLMQEIRYMDKVVDELAKGKSVEKILRK